MGTYLSTPLREKTSDDQECEKLSYGASSMQGWRISQEDAHNCNVDFDTDTNTSLFAVYDGHGGAEVALYTAKNLPNFLKNLESYKSGQLAKALEEAFLGFDATLIDVVVVKELKDIAGLETNEDDGEDEEVKQEAALLREEATMPIEKLLERYGGVKANPQLIRTAAKANKFQSPVVRKKSSSTSDLEGSKDSNNMQTEEKASDDTIKLNLASTLANETANEEEGILTSVSSTTSIQTSTVENSTIKINTDQAKIQSNNETLEPDLKETDNQTNDVCDNEFTNNNNNNNASTTQASSDVDNSKLEEMRDETNDSKLIENKNIKSSTIDNQSKLDKVEESSEVIKSTCKESISNTNQNGEVGSSDNHLPWDKRNGIESTNSDVSNECSTDIKESKKKLSIVGSSSKTISSKKASVTKDKDDSSSGEKSIDDDDDDNSEEDAEDDDSEEEDEKWNSDENEDESDDDDNDDERFRSLFANDEEDDDDEMEDEDDPYGGLMTTGEKPGSDSGCTAVVSLLRGNELYVANAGDSRCVVCRGTTALDMSIDHKPEDTIEHDRIKKAGGKITPDGRVNGGLNLSRAIGDHAYKKNAKLSLSEQMITSLPDVKHVVLNEEEDKFMVLACDGIWNVLSSQEVVDFILKKLETENTSLSSICEQLFDACIAPDTSGDGTGCDNMTCVIVKFNKLNRQLKTTDCHQKTTERMSEIEMKTVEEKDLNCVGADGDSVAVCTKVIDAEATESNIVVRNEPETEITIGLVYEVGKYTRPSLYSSRGGSMALSNKRKQDDLKKEEEEEREKNDIESVVYRSISHSDDVKIGAKGDYSNGDIKHSFDESNDDTVGPMAAKRSKKDEPVGTDVDTGMCE